MTDRPTEPDGLTDFLTRDLSRMRAAGCSLAAAAVHVIGEYDGLHRLSLAVAEWASVIAGEGGRAEREHAPIETGPGRIFYVEPGTLLGSDPPPAFDGPPPSPEAWEALRRLSLPDHAEATVETPEPDAPEATVTAAPGSARYFTITSSVFRELVAAGLLVGVPGEPRWRLARPAPGVETAPVAEPTAQGSGEGKAATAETAALPRDASPLSPLLPAEFDALRIFRDRGTLYGRLAQGAEGTEPAVVFVGAAVGGDARAVSLAVLRGLQSRGLVVIEDSGEVRTKADGPKAMLTETGRALVSRLGDRL